MRLEIVRQLAGCGAAGELECGEIGVPVTKSTASHHFKTLLDAGVIAEREEGRCKYIQLRRDELDRRFPGLIDSVLRATGLAPEATSRCCGSAGRGAGEAGEQRGQRLAL